MCATVLAPQVAMTTPFVAAARYQDSNLRRMEHAGDREQPLGRKWVVVIDEHGNRRLQMRWTVARVVPPAAVCEATWPCVEPAVGRESEPTLGPQAQVADAFIRYGFRALPVTDENDIILGVVLYRDVMNLKHRMLD